MGETNLRVTVAPVAAGRLSFDGYRLAMAGQQLSLSPKEAAMLRLLADWAGEVVSFDQIYENIWPEGDVSIQSVNRCISTLRKKIEHGGVGIVSHYNMGYSLSGEISYKGSPGHSKLIQNNEPNVDCVIKLGESYLGLRQPQNCLAALTLLNNYADKNPPSARIFAAIAEIEVLRIMRCYVPPLLAAETINYFARLALDLHPEHPEALAALGWTEVVVRKNDNGLAYLDRAVAQSTATVRATYYRGWGLCSLGRQDEAISDLYRAVDLSGPVPVNAAALGLSLFVTGRTEEARRVLRKSALALPWDDLTHYGISVLEGWAGNHMLAIESAKRAFELNSGKHPQITANLAYVLARAGSQMEAEAALKAARAIESPEIKSSLFVPALFALEGLESAKRQYESACAAGCPHTMLIRRDPRLSAIFKS